jgi:hypothetical protein
LERSEKKHNDVCANFQAYQEQKEMATLQSVVLKHHDKAKLIKKKQKEIMELREFKAEKKLESEMHFQQKIKVLNQEKDEKRGKIKQKFKKLDSAKQAMENSLYEYMVNKKEENEKKSEEHTKSYQKVQRARSAYKAHLCAKLMEKNIRGNDVIAIRQQNMATSATRPLLEAATLVK